MARFIIPQKKGETDLNTNRILISNQFSYFGEEMINLNELKLNTKKEMLICGRGHKTNNDFEIYKIFEKLITDNIRKCNSPSSRKKHENNT